MTACLQWLIDASVSLSLLVALLLLIRRPVARHMGAVTAYRLWLLVPLHLAAPFLIPEALVMYQVELAPLTVRHDDTTPFMASASAPGWSVAVLLWLSGLACTLVHLSLAMLGVRRLVRESCPLPSEARQELPVTGLDRRHVRESSSIGAPIVAGLFRPTLLLPNDFAERHTAEERRLILAHEACHMRRRDNLATVAARLCTALFWFNPLAHLAYRAFRTDQELSCDAMVLHGSGPGERKAYGRALVKSAATMDTVAVTSSWQNQNHLKERTMMLTSHRNTRVRRLAGYGTFATLFIAVIVLSVDALAFDAETKSGKAEPVLDAPAVAVRVNPKYPRAAAEDKIEGHVAMRFLVSTDGSVKDIEVIESSPKGLFEDEAIEAMKQWRFEPGRMDGETVPMKAVQVIRFELD